MGDFIGNLPDWLGIVLAVAGLFGGSGAGVYYGSIRRARLDDRRELLKEWMPWLTRGMLQLDPPTLPRDLEEPITPDDHLTYDLALANATADGLNAITDLVELLPWQDRAMWRNYVGCLQKVAGAHNLWFLLDRNRGGFERVDALRSALAGRRPLTNDDREAVKRKDLLGFALVRSGDEFRDYLLQVVNPSPFVSSWRKAAASLRLVVGGSWPLSETLRVRAYRRSLWVPHQYDEGLAIDVVAELGQASASGDSEAAELLQHLRPANEPSKSRIARRLDSRAGGRESVRHGGEADSP